MSRRCIRDLACCCRRGYEDEDTGSARQLRYEKLANAISQREQAIEFTCDWLPADYAKLSCAWPWVLLGLECGGAPSLMAPLLLPRLAAGCVAAVAHLCLRERKRTCF
jgi:hypothetical protein